MKKHQILTLAIFFAYAITSNAQLSSSSGKTMIALSVLSVLQPVAIQITILSESAHLSASGNNGITIPSGSTLTVAIDSGKLRSERIHNEASSIQIDCPKGCQTKLQIAPQFSGAYHGNITLTPYHNTINIVLHIDKEELVGGILASEMAHTDSREALRAFAVVTRSFLQGAKRHPSRHADLCDTTHCQVFRRLEPTEMIRSAVRDTSRMVLTYRKSSFRPYYFQSCGGTTATYAEVWNRPSPDYPFFGVSCEACQQRTWDTTLHISELKTLGSWPRIQSMLSGNTSQREAFRILAGRLYGWDRIPSNDFTVDMQKDQIIIHGRGNGHRVGFCQDGARWMAAKQKTFQEILAYYFPQSSIRLTP